MQELYAKDLCIVQCLGKQKVLAGLMHDAIAEGYCYTISDYMLPNFRMCGAVQAQKYMDELDASMLKQEAEIDAAWNKHVKVDVPVAILRAVGAWEYFKIDDDISRLPTDYDVVERLQGVYESLINTLHIALDEGLPSKRKILMLEDAQMINTVWDNMYGEGAMSDSLYKQWEANSEWKNA